MPHSILEYFGEQKKINIPESIKIRSNKLHVEADRDLTEKEEKLFHLKYNSLEDYYLAKAFKEFKLEESAPLICEGFFILTDDMKKDEIVDYLKFVLL